MDNVQDVLDRMMSRLERAIEMGSGQGALRAKAELGGALDLALVANIISPGEYSNRSGRMVDAYYDAVDAKRLDFGL